MKGLYGLDDTFNGFLDSKIDEIFNGRKKRKIFMASEMAGLRTKLSKDVSTATKQMKTKQLNDIPLTQSSEDSNNYIPR